MNTPPPEILPEKTAYPSPVDPAVEEEPKNTGATEQERIDEAIAESFPASDPPSWTSGVKQDEDELTEDSSKK